MRNNSIDILKIIAMFMVVIEHMLIYTNIKVSFINSDILVWIYFFVRTLCKINVNLFVICSAYLLHQKKFKFKNYLKIVLYTVLVSIVSMCVYSVITNSYPEKIEIIKSMLPILSNSFWFISCYLGLLLIYPMLDNFISSFSEKKSLLIAVIIIYISTFIYPNCFILNENNNLERTVFWMIALYIIAVSINKFNVNKRPFIFLGVTSFVLLWFSSVMFQKLGIRNFLLTNDSPLVLFLSLVIFRLLNNNWVCSNSIQRRIITVASSSTLLVYLVHENVCRSIIWEFVNYIWEYIPVAVIIIPFLFFWFGIIITYVLKVPISIILNTRISVYICSKIDHIYERIQSSK